MNFVDVSTTILNELNYEFTQQEQGNVFKSQLKSELPSEISDIILLDQKLDRTQYISIRNRPE